LQDDALPKIHPANPVGMGWLSDWKLLPADAAIDLPQILAVGADFVPGRVWPDAQGFGVLQPHWHARLQYAGTYDAVWKTDRHPRLPLDFDLRFHQSVLSDQWADIVGGEQVEIENAHANGALRFRLPQMIVAAHTEIGMLQHHGRLRIVAVDVDTDTDTVSMVWNGSVACNGQDSQVKCTTLRIQQISGVAA
jgi:hypothetical protein